MKRRENTNMTTLAAATVRRCFDHRLQTDRPDSTENERRPTELSKFSPSPVTLTVESQNQTHHLIYDCAAAESRSCRRGRRWRLPVPNMCSQIAITEENVVTLNTCICTRHRNHTHALEESHNTTNRRGNRDSIEIFLFKIMQIRFWRFYNGEGA
jgi:hypothetical protein